MPKVEDNQSVMNPNLVYFSLMYTLRAMYFSGHRELNWISLYTSFHIACVENTHSAVSILTMITLKSIRPFNNNHFKQKCIKLETKCATSLSPKLITCLHQC